MRPILAVIFDIDGTLVDSVDLHAEAWRLAFAHYGRTVPHEKVRGQIGKGADQLMPTFLCPDELERFGQELQEYRGRLFRERFLPQVRAFPHVRDLLWRLRLDHKQVALASSAEEDELAAYLRIAGVADLVETATSAGDAERSKPHPDIIEAALERMGRADPLDAVMVGDSPYDAIAARALRVRAFGVLTGKFTAAELREAGCARVFRDVSELLEVYPFRTPVVTCQASA